MAMGAGIIELDILTLGSSSLAKGTAKTVGKEIVEVALKDGMKVTSSKALEMGEKFLGKGYKETVHKSGRYISADGERVFRMGETDILGLHGGGPHVNFETLIPNPANPSKMMVDENIHVFITP